MNMTMISNDIQHKAKKSQKHIQQPEDMTWNMDHLLKYRNVVYAVKELPMISIKIDQKMFGILVDHHPHLHGLWKLGTPKSSESSKSKGFSWFLLVSPGFSSFFSLKINIQWGVPTCSDRLRSFFLFFGRSPICQRHSPSKGRKHCTEDGARRHGNERLEPSKIFRQMSSHGAMAKKKNSFQCTSRT